MRFLLIFFLLIITQICDLNGQPEFKPGYVILNNGDTLTGKIDNRGDMLMSQLCRFNPVDRDTIIHYKPGNIEAYRFVDGKYYVSRRLESGKQVFLEYLINGELNIYYYRGEDGYNFYLVDKAGMPLKKIPYKEELRMRDDGSKVLYQSKIHVGLLQAYTRDAEGFYEETLKIESPDHENLIAFAEKYHNMVCEDEVCIIYEKNVPGVRIAVEMVYGISRYNGESFNFNRTDDYGFHAYFWMPKANERLFFKTGFISAPLNHDGIKNIVKIPTQIVYEYPLNRLKPVAFMGVNQYFIKILDLVHFWSLSPGLGLNYDIIGDFSLSASFQADFAPMAPILKHRNTGLLSYSFYIGLRMGL